jgi:cell division protease FtsH
VAPIVLMFILLLFIMRRAQGGQDNILGIGRSKAKVFVKGKQDVKFKDVGGMKEAKQELEEIVDFMKHPKKYTKVGARTPKGVLLVGPSGTGKTLLARAVAGEANVQFLSIAGSEFMEMLVGVGASRARDLFATAKKLAPSIIFIDEIDAIGRMRGHGSMGGHDEREQTLNQILVEMDGFSQNDNVIVMAATNRGDLLDPALVRPGRFDRRVTLSLPDLEERKYILSIHARKKPFASDVNWDSVAKRTVGFSGADLENMLNEAAIAVARTGREAINMEDIEESSLKVKLGPSKKRMQDEYERKMTSYHEAGHAVIAHVSPYADPVHRISIVSRGRALGFTLTPPERDKLQITQSEMIDEIAVLLGGRAAEKLIFNELTAGASSDIQRATSIARSMVVDYGMSKLGPMNFSPQYEGSDYSRAMGEPMKISDRLQEQVDAEISALIGRGEKRALELLKKHQKQLEAVAEKLLEVESLDADEFAELMGTPKSKKSA